MPISFQKGGHILYTLLISDDEFYTRKGIIKELPLERLQINTIIEAEDGLDALEKTENSKPDIVLTDVRMPRMNGIDMAFELRKKYPDCIIIFMSGFSDKEYLRSAIKLQAIHYVDKPIDVEELVSALEEAVQICQERDSSANIILSAKKNELALNLIHKNQKQSDIDDKIKAAGLYEHRLSYCLTILVRALPEYDEDSESISLKQQFILSHVNATFQKYDLLYICNFKDNENLIIHVFNKKIKIFLSIEHLFLPLLTDLSVNLNTCPHFISVGSTEKSLYNIYNSYRSAVLSMQDNFYLGLNTITFYDDLPKTSYVFKEQLIETFEEYIIKKDYDNVRYFIKELTNNFSSHRGTLISNVKNTYFCLILRLSQIADMKQINFSKKLGKNQFIWEYILHSNTLNELERFLLECLYLYIDESNYMSKSNNLIYSMLNYIDENSSNPDLTLDKISNHMQLSSSYLSLIFKEETNKTINQYITECRIEKAKKYLLDLRLKISEVGLKSGYTDNNYFAKVFKKHVGVSPSEYRDGNPV